MAKTSKGYCLSLTGASTRCSETIAAARAYVDCHDWDEVSRLIVDENLFGLNSDSNRKRIRNEITKRLKALSDEEIVFLSNALDHDQFAMLWVALCRTYPIVRSVATELLVSRFDRMLPDLPRGAYKAFIEEEKYEHRELADLTEKSLDKVEIRVFGMLRDCRLLDDSYRITPLYPSERFASLVAATHPEDLSLFPKVGVLA